MATDSFRGERGAVDHRRGGGGGGLGKNSCCF
jgi:hypothetical protein